MMQITEYLSETVNGEVTEYEYNAAGLLKTQTNPNGENYVLTYMLDGNIYTQSKNSDSKGIIEYKRYTYDGIGQLTLDSYANLETNMSINDRYTYDSRGNRITKKQAEAR